MEKKMKTIHLKIIFAAVGALVLLLASAAFIDPPVDYSLQEIEVRNPLVKK